MSQHATTVTLERDISCEREASSSPWGQSLMQPGDRFLDSLPAVTHLDAVLGPLLQVRDNRVVPKINKPRSKLIHCDRTWQEKTRTWGHKGGGGVKLKWGHRDTHQSQIWSLSDPVQPWSRVSYQWGSLMCCASPGRRAGDTRAWGPSPTPWSGPRWSGSSRSPTPSSSCAGIAPGSRWLVPRCWRRSPSFEIES